MTAPAMLAAMMKLELPENTARMVDGGRIDWAGESYSSRDDLLGVAAAFEALTEGVADEAPAGAITFLPPDASGSATLLDADWQGSRMRLWIADADPETGAVIGAPEQMVDWIVDYSELVLGIGKRELTIAFVAAGERLFQLERGNSLSPVFHRSIYPGEAGLNNASGVTLTVAWGAQSPPRGVSGAGGGGGGAGSGGGRERLNYAQL